MDTPQTSHPGRITDPAHFEVLAEPTRFAIFETLQLGQASIREIGERLDLPPASLYRHVAALETAGLVKRTEQVPTQRRAAWIYSCAQSHPALAYLPEDPAALAGLAKVVHVLAQRAGREFDVALGQPDTVASGPGRNLFAAQAQGWLDDTELARANELLAELLDLFSSGARRAETQLVSLAAILRPPRSRRTPG